MHQEEAKTGQKLSVWSSLPRVPNRRGEEVVYSNGVDEFGHARLGGVDYYIGKEIEKRFENIDTMVVVLGHLQLGGSPNTFDRGSSHPIWNRRDRSGARRQIRPDGCHPGKRHGAVPLKDVVGKRKTVDLKLYEIAATFFG